MKKIFGIFVICLLLSVIYIWYSDFGFVREKISGLFASPLKFLTQDLSASEVKKLSNIPGLRKFYRPIQPNNPDVAKKLKFADNVLLYLGDSSDTTGRTMLVDTNQNLHLKIMGLGMALTAFETSKSGVKVQKKTALWELGLFKAWARIPESLDLYLVLTDPERNRDFIIRVLREKKACFPSKKDPSITNLAVHNISFRDSMGVFDELGPIASWSETDLAKLIKPNDFIVIHNQKHSDFIRNKFGLNLRKDNASVLCADSVVIHRFGGKQQLEKELARNISDFTLSPMFNRILEMYHFSMLKKIPGL